MLKSHSSFFYTEHRKMLSLASYLFCHLTVTDMENCVCRRRQRAEGEKCISLGEFPVWILQFQEVPKRTIWKVKHFF